MNPLARGTPQRVTCHLTGRISKEGEWYVAECVGLPVVTQGETDSEAISNLMEAVQLFIESCVAEGTLEQVLLKNSWRPVFWARHNHAAARDFAVPIRVLPAIARALECRA